VGSREEAVDLGDVMAATGACGALTSKIFDGGLGANESLSPRCSPGTTGAVTSETLRKLDTVSDIPDPIPSELPCGLWELRRKIAREERPRDRPTVSAATKQKTKSAEEFLILLDDVVPYVAFALPIRNETGS